LSVAEVKVRQLQKQIEEKVKFKPPYLLKAREAISCLDELTLIDLKCIVNPHANVLNVMRGKWK
jgi:hypothetical protein